MKVLLVNPPSTHPYVAIPLGLGYVGAALKKRGHEVRIFDYCLRRKLDYFRPDWFGISGLSSQYPAMKELAKRGKSLGATVVMGGAHASSLPEYILSDCPDVDYVIKGEGEIAFADLIEGRVGPGVFSREVHNAPIYIQDLDSLDFPWGALNVNSYADTLVSGLSVRRPPISTVISSRGCPYRCTFCSTSTINGKIVRMRSVDNFLDEVRWLVQKRGIREIRISDDNFTFDYNRTYSIVEGLARLDIAWTLPNGIRADKVDRPLLAAMKRSGCYYFGIGIESGSPRILKSICKDLDLSTVESTVREANKLGFLTQGFLIMGLPGETVSDTRETADFVSSTPLDRISVCNYMPLPGSSLFEGIDPKTVNWEGLDRRDSKIPVEFRRSIQRLYLRFYLNPRRILRLVRKAKSFTEYVGLFRGLKTLVSEVSRRQSVASDKELHGSSKA